MASTGGFILGLVGGLLDFASASMLLIAQVPGTDMMGEMPPPDYLWAGILIALGVLVVVTTLLSAATMDARVVRLAPFMMTAFGAIMVAIGSAMSGGYIVTGEMSQIYSYGMVLVGVLMMANGIIMLRGPNQMGSL